jgi:hypothetical protein
MRNPRTPMEKQSLSILAIASARWDNAAAALMVRSDSGMNQHHAVRVAKTDIQRILAVLALTPGLELDEQLKLSMLEGETDLFEVVRALLNENEDDDGTIAALDKQVDDRAIRIERAKDADRGAQESDHFADGQRTGNHPEAARGNAFAPHPEGPSEGDRCGPVTRRVRDD